MQEQSPPTTLLISDKPPDVKHKSNIKSKIKLVSPKNLLEVTTKDSSLINPFSDKTASPEQQHDLLNLELSET